MKTIIVLFAISFSFQAFSQDIINLKDGNEIYSKVLKITDMEVEYKKFSNLNGPIYTKKISQVENIKFQNGSKEVFNTKDNNSSKDDNQSANKAFKSENKNIVIAPPENDGKGIAKVEQINGIDIYFMSKPLLHYKIVFSSGDLMSDIDLKSIFWGGLARAHVDDKVKKIINAAYRKSEREEIPIHAVIYSGGHRAIAIQYTNKELKSERLAKVDKRDNVDIYVFSEPYGKEYNIVKTAAAKSGGLTSLITYGIVNSTMENDIEQLVDRLNPKKNNLDGVIYLDGKRGSGIRYTN